MLQIQSVLALLTKDSTALREFMGNRVAEILHSTTFNQWYHVASKDNIADLGTRGSATINDVAEESDWQRGPNWMYLPVPEWPLSQEVKREDIPEDELIRS